MATYHLRAKHVSRGKGQSAIAAAAYRSGERLTDERTGEVKDFTTRRDAIAFEGIFAPKNAPDWARDRQQLWNHVEQFENRKDARLARELEISLPHELTDQQREWLVKDFVRENFVRQGYAVDVAIHNPGPKNDERNFHAHLMVTPRQLNVDGFEPLKDFNLDRKEQLLEWREKWADLSNRHLERHGHEARIDHRSHEARDIEAEPSKFEGPNVTEMARRGEITDRRRENDEIRERNKAHSQDSQLDRPLTLKERADLAFQQTQERMRDELAEEDRRRDAGVVSQPETSQQKQFRELKESQRDEREALKAVHELERDEFNKALTADRQQHYKKGQPLYNAAAAQAFAEVSHDFRDDWKKLVRDGLPEHRDEWKMILRDVFTSQLAERRQELFSLVKDERRAAWNVTYRSAATDFYREQREERDGLKAEHAAQWEKLREDRRQEAEAQRDAGDQWTSRGGMVAQQEEALSRTSTATERREDRAEASRTEKAEAYFRDLTQPRRIERPSEERAAEQVEKPSQDPAHENAPQDLRGSRESEQHRREEAKRESAAEPTVQRDGAEREKTEAQVQRESRKGGYELTERQRQILEAARGRNDVGRDQDGGRERD